jgi:hypothetical protein
MIVSHFIISKNTAMASQKSNEYEFSKGDGEWHHHLPSTLSEDGELTRDFAESEDHHGDGTK